MNARIENYLKAYNLLQLTGWTFALLSLPFNFSISFYTVCIFQIISMVEIFHAWKKWNNSSPVYCFLQLSARLMILFFSYTIALITIFKPIHFFSEVLIILIIVWSLAEIIRYAFYLSQLFKLHIKIFTWWRYTAFTILYPAGILSEFYILYLMFILNNLIIIKILVIILGIVYLVVFPMLYLHLLKQRQKKMRKEI